MRINNNISAMNAHRLLNINNIAGSKSLEKLSSGKRINKAADDAAGMAISEKMRAQISGLKIASRNTLDGVSMVQTAEGAMAEITAMLQRMRELAVQAANGTMTEADRSAIQDEINQLTSEINRIGNGTEYNTRKILRGNEGPNSNTIVHRMSTGAPARVITKSLGVDSEDEILKINFSNKDLAIEINGKKSEVNLQGFTGETNETLTAKEFLTRINDALGDDAVATFNDSFQIEIKTTKPGGGQDIKITGSALNLLFGGEIPNINGVPTVQGIGQAENSGGTSKGSFYFTDIPQRGSFITIGNERIDFYDSSIEPYVGTNKSVDISKLVDGEHEPKTIEEIVSEIATTIKLQGVEFEVGNNNSKELIVISEKIGFEGNLINLEGTLKEFNTNLQIGANSGQGFRLEIGDIRALSLRISSNKPTGNPGVKGASYVAIPNVTDGISSNLVEYALDVSTEDKASAAITVIDNALLKVTAERSKLGATQNRLEHTIKNLDNTAENLTSSLSRIEDVDMALEMANFTKFNVLQQAGVSMLAQANQQPQNILKLLG
ncbi:flagellin [Alkalithermobacter thermoalcaliphilus JW-YL-7 = DSM 7308]|uniref:Flagellin n=1 Tax=Alkalithermobacter thermoalcaliphilus JW-YL-7 = DSM 7308 TaxID=1121328 RepID=A0A150FN74_CLOPD|nr:flagellin domain protein [[Clostridium] paradoxum JW-YL-7 = DSM 7308]SHL06467.1 flagellin [[Clostridium] paradoxum JW-YL-7 = DSM 7308]